MPSIPAVSAPYTHEPNRTWPSAYADNGTVTWTTTRSDENGNLAISFPRVRWDRIRASEGWAGLQYHSVLRTVLTLHPPLPHLAGSASCTPRLRLELNRGSFFAIVPRDDSSDSSTTFVPEWHAGNIYDHHHALPNTVELSVLASLNQPSLFDLFVSGDYEIRLFGDPQVQQEDGPILKICVSVRLEAEEYTIVREDNEDVICDFIEGLAFGDAVGIGLRSVGGWWKVTALINPEEPSTGVSLSLRDSFTIAPTQTIVVPLELRQSRPYHGHSLQFSIALSSTVSETEIIVPVALDVRHHSLWTTLEYTPLRASFFYAYSHPTAFLAIPPKRRCSDEHRPPVLALHGAGVDIFAMPFWADSLPRQTYSWLVLPAGRTEWGLDWHGPSAAEAWNTIPALDELLKRHEQTKNWRNTHEEVVILGHSNGGQGTWCLSSRYPDRVLAAIPAAAYIKSQAYIPLTLGRSRHFIDPMLRSILESSLTADDNDLFLSNLSGTPVLAIHGGEDENVPTWHSREYADIMSEWTRPDDSKFTYYEDMHQPHWYSSVFTSPHVLRFLDSVLLRDENEEIKVYPFTLTVLEPAFSGPMRGWSIDILTVPGRLSRLRVEKQQRVYYVRSMNVLRFSVDCREVSGVDKIIIDHKHSLTVARGFSQKVGFVRSSGGVWALDSSDVVPSRRGRAQNILTSDRALSIIIPNPTLHPTSLRLALRLSQSLHVYHHLHAQIKIDRQALEELQERRIEIPPGNIIIIGGSENAFGARLLQQGLTSFELKDGHIALNGRTIEESSYGAMFTHPHPIDGQALVLFMVGGDATGLERIFHLFPLRTGISVPDWIIIGVETDSIGAAGVIGAGVWSNNWKWSDAMSWMY